MFLVPSLMVSASNISGIWMVRAMGESEFAQLLQNCAERSTPAKALAGVLASSAFIFIVGFCLCLFAEGESDWAYWFGVGILIYALVSALHRSLYYLRLFKKT